jgi:fatty acid desaturase
MVEAGLLERVLIAPIGFHYHYEHHLYPAIPYHRLSEVRRRLRAIGHYDAPGIVASKGYLRTVVQLATTHGSASPAETTP